MREWTNRSRVYRSTSRSAAARTAPTSVAATARLHQTVSVRFKIAGTKPSQLAGDDTIAMHTQANLFVRKIEIEMCEHLSVTERTVPDEKLRFFKARRCHSSES